MKNLTTTVVVIFLVFISVVFVYGFISKQKSENNIQNNATQSQSTSSLNMQTNNNTLQSNTNIQNQNITAEQVAKHSSTNNCWLIIHGNAYNVTNFLDQHPGGADVIIPYCGRDATTAFDMQGGHRHQGHSQTAQQILQNYLVGAVQ